MGQRDYDKEDWDGRTAEKGRIRFQEDENLMDRWNIWKDGSEVGCIENWGPSETNPNDWQLFLLPEFEFDTKLDEGSRFANVVCAKRYACDVLMGRPAGADKWRGEGE